MHPQRLRSPRKKISFANNWTTSWIAAMNCIALTDSAQCIEQFGQRIPIRLLVGLQYLKQLYALSDEEVVTGGWRIPIAILLWGGVLSAYAPHRSVTDDPLPAADWGRGL